MPENYNNNVLKGYGCPRCESVGPFYVDVTATLLVYDDGTDTTFGDVEWEDDATFVCFECKHTGQAREFQLG